MDKQEVIAHLCELVSHVGREVFHSQLEHDCICHEQSKHNAGREQIHPEVVAFIDNAVFAAIADRQARNKVKP